MGLPITGCAALLIINPAGPVHSVDTVTSTSANGLSSTVQLRLMEDPTIVGAIGGVTATLVAAGTNEDTYGYNIITIK